MSGPLAGVLVVALEQAVAAPLCSARLADAGARVIKIERPGGDFARGYDRAVKGHSAYFVWVNRGKESIVLDIKEAEDRALLARMIARADVFVQNLAPGAAARAGFDSAALRRRHPRLITCDISGYGDRGPLRDRKAYDLLVQAESGLVSLTGTPAAAGRVGVSVCDIAAGMNAWGGVLEALLARTHSGRGAGVSVSLFDAMADWMSVPLLQTVYGDRPPRRHGLAHPTIAPYGAFDTADGVQVVISIQNDREWRRFCAEILGNAALAEHPDYVDNPSRVAHRAALDGMIAGVFVAHSAAVLTERLDRAGIAFGRVNGAGDLADHPQLRQWPVALGDDVVALNAPPVHRSDAAEEFAAVPTLDQHGAALRAEFGA